MIMGMKEFFDSLTDRLHSSSSVKTVYGEPLETQGKTIIPVAKVAYGFGGGYGESKDDKKEGHNSEGGGVGGGLAVKPVGVIEVTKEETRFIPLSGKKKLAGMLVLGFVLGFIIGRR
jgi:uncharacterized spore protein YtfJ